MSSPLITLAVLLIGLGAGVLLVASLLRGSSPAVHSWSLAAAIVAVVALGAYWPGKLRGSAQVLDGQRITYAATDERTAREKCLNDMGRPDLVQALAFAREQIPEDAEFAVTTNSPSVACLMINLFPRRPVAVADPARHWTVFDRTAPANVVEDATRQQRLPEAERRYLTHSPSFILVRPEPEAGP